VLYQLSYAPGSPPDGRPAGSPSARLVGLTGLEPETSRLSGGRSNQLSYSPEFCRQASTQHELRRTLRDHRQAAARGRAARADALAR
jgi:hypothetical protein